MKVHGINAGDTLSGPVTLTADAHGASYVEYLLSGRPLSGPIASAPYSYTWDARDIWDGPETIQAIAFDQSGKEIGRSDVVPFTVAWGGQHATIKIISPDPGSTVHGPITFEVQADRVISDAEIARDKVLKRDVKEFEGLVYAVDGDAQPVQFGANHGKLTVDTTTLANGEHELFIGAYSSNTVIPPVSGPPAVAMAMETVDVENGHVVRAMLPKFADMRLQPGARLAVAPWALYTDGAPGPLPGPVTYASSDPSVARVDPGGVVTAVAQGVATVTLTCGNLTSTARVLVDPPLGFPHFAADGEILKEYDPARSTFVKTLFFLNPDEVNKLPALADQLKFAGVNALTTGFYFNPGDGGNPNETFEQWKAGWAPWFGASVSSAQKLGFNLLLTGDDICRNTGELYNSITNPWAPQAIQEAFTGARDSKRVVGIEMIDEASGAWGGTPFPTDGAWLGRTPPIPDTAFQTLMTTINAVPNRPPITWPVLGIAPPIVAHNWMGDPRISDYASNYWDVLDWRRVYPWGASLSQEMVAMDHAVVDRYPVLMHDRPQFLLTAITGPFYDKGGEGSGPEFTRGVDNFIQGGPRPVDVCAEIMYGVARGMAGIRSYGYDWSLWKQARATDKPGSEEQTGSDPFVVGTDRWWAMAAAYTTIDRLMPWIIQPQVSAEDLGPHIITGARIGPRGKLFIAVNGLEMPQRVTVDLTPYHPKGWNLTRIRVVGATTYTEALPASSTHDTITLKPGETVIYLSPDPKSGYMPPDSVRIVSPLPDATVAGRIRVAFDFGFPISTDEREGAVLIDGKAIGDIPESGRTVDISSLKPGVWHCLAIQHTYQGKVVGEARQMFFAPGPASQNSGTP